MQSPCITWFEEPGAKQSGYTVTLQYWGRGRISPGEPHWSTGNLRPHPHPVHMGENNKHSLRWSYSQSAQHTSTSILSQGCSHCRLMTFPAFLWLDGSCSTVLLPSNTTEDGSPTASSGSRQKTWRRWGQMGQYILHACMKFLNNQ